MTSPATVLADVDALVGAWCDRRCFRALREILAAWPMTSGLTDAWGELGVALERVRAFAREELTDAELVTVGELLREVERVVRRS